MCNTRSAIRFKNGINSLKQHIVNIKGGVEISPTPLTEEKSICIRNNEVAMTKVERKKVELKLCNEVYISKNKVKRVNLFHWLKTTSCGGPLDKLVDQEKV